jgi:hypothetical protein
VNCTIKHDESHTLVLESATTLKCMLFHDDWHGILP